MTSKRDTNQKDKHRDNYFSIDIMTPKRKKYEGQLADLKHGPPAAQCNRADFRECTWCAIDWSASIECFTFKTGPLVQFVFTITSINITIAIKVPRVSRLQDFCF